MIDIIEVEAADILTMAQVDRDNVFLRMAAASPEILPVYFDLMNALVSQEIEDQRLDLAPAAPKKQVLAPELLIRDICAVLRQIEVLQRLHAQTDGSSAAAQKQPTPPVYFRVVVPEYDTGSGLRTHGPTRYASAAQGPAADQANQAVQGGYRLYSGGAALGPGAFQLSVKSYERGLIERPSFRSPFTKQMTLRFSERTICESVTTRQEFIAGADEEFVAVGYRFTADGEPVIFDKFSERDIGVQLHKIYSRALAAYKALRAREFFAAQAWCLRWHSASSRHSTPSQQNEMGVWLPRGLAPDFFADDPLLTAVAAWEPPAAVPPLAEAAQATLATIGHGTATKQAVYLAARIHGKDSAEAKQAQEALETAIRIAEFRQLHARRLAAQKLEENQILNAAAQLLDAAQMAKIQRALPASKYFGAQIIELIVEIAGKGARPALERAVEQARQYQLALTSNKCKHLAAYRALKRARNYKDQADKLDALLEFAAGGGGGSNHASSNQASSNHASSNHASSHSKKPPDSKQMQRTQIACKDCGFPLICPHLVTLIRNRGEYDPAQMEPFVQSVPQQNVYFCAICFERLADAEAQESLLADYDAKNLNNLSDELRTLMWTEIGATLAFVNLGPAIVKTKLIKLIIAIIYDFIFALDKDLIRSKTNTAADIVNSERLFVAIFTYAALTHLMLSHSSAASATAGAGGGATAAALSFNNINKKIDAKPPYSAADYLKYSILNILGTKQALLKEIKGATPELVKEKMIVAYKLILANSAHRTIEAATAGDLLSMPAVLNDPVYHMVLALNRLAAKQRKIYDFVADPLQPAYGMIFATPQKKNRESRPDYVFAEAVLPTPTGKLDMPRDYVLHHLHDDQPVDLHYKLACAAAFMTRYRDHLNERGVVCADLQQDPRSGMPSVVVSKTFALFFEVLDKLNRDAAPLVTARARARCKASSRTPAARDRKHQDRSRELWVEFDEQGRPHKFDKFVYAASSASSPSPSSASAKAKAEGEAVVVLTPAEILKAFEAGTIAGKPIDRECSVCGIRETKLSTLDPKKIQAALDTNLRIANFYTFFTARCLQPTKYATHQFVHKRCSQCNIEQAHCLPSANAEDPARRQFALDNYSKFQAMYLADARPPKPEATKPLLQKGQTEAATAAAAAARGYKFTMTNVVRACSELKINKNAFLCLGAHYKTAYATITAGAFTPPQPETTDDTRLTVVESYTLFMRSRYMQLKHAHSLRRPPLELAALLETSDIAQHELPRLAEVLPDLEPRARPQLTAFATPQLALEFLLDELAKFILWCLDTAAAIAKAPGALSGPIALLLRAVTADNIKRLLKHEEHNTTYGVINWNVFKVDTVDLMAATDSTDHETTPDADASPDEVGEAADQEDKEDLEDAGATAAPTDPFKNNFDLDIGADETEEDFENDVKVEDNNCAGL